MISLRYVHLDDSDYWEFKVVRLQLRLGRRAFLVEAGIDREFTPDKACRVWTTGPWRPRLNAQTWRQEAV